MRFNPGGLDIQSREIQIADFGGSLSIINYYPMGHQITKE